jgi:hypothetical protein
MIRAFDEYKAAGVAIHVAASGGAAGLQRELWGTPGSSAYLSGGSFPYAESEMADLLGFTPDRFCCPETAADLACAAYMKAFRFGGKLAVGLGVTAAVATDREIRGGHRVHACAITEKRALSASWKLTAGTGTGARAANDADCTWLGLCLLRAAVFGERAEGLEVADATELVTSRVFERPFFRADGARSAAPDRFSGLMPGAFNPPHEAHFQIRSAATRLLGSPIAFQITADTPHKPTLSPAELLQRAKMLRGHDVLITRGDPLYLDKARRFPGTAFVIGADALDRMLDPCWGPGVVDLLCELSELGASFLVAPRRVGSKLLTLGSVLDRAGVAPDRSFMFIELRGCDFAHSSTEIRRTA